LFQKNFKKTIQNLGNRAFKHQAIAEAELRFEDPNFAYKLDQDVMVRGVGNGVLVLPKRIGEKPILVQGFHSYLISKYTKTPYIAFNPYDEKTKEILFTIRNMWPDNEPDSHNFVMSFMASSIDAQIKDSLFVILWGQGANGKSFLMEMHKAALGSLFAVKIDINFLMSRASSAENATPLLMMLK
jgi:hypothetical protein